MIQTAKIFTTGRSQAVRLPRTFRFQPSQTEVVVSWEGSSVVLTPKTENWMDVYHQMPVLDDFDVGPAQAFEQREDF